MRELMSNELDQVSGGTRTPGGWVNKTHDGSGTDLTFDNGIYIHVGNDGSITTSGTSTTTHPK